MNYFVLDSKLKSLIKVCKETKNYKKLAIVTFILTSNKMDDIGIKLGIRPRDKASSESIFEYVKLINKVLGNSLNLTLFKEDLINTLKTIEVQFLKRNGDIPLDYIKKMFKVYYELRKFDIPNVYESYNSELVSQSVDTNLYSIFSTNKIKSKKQKVDRIKPLILHKIREKELSIRDKLEKSYDKNLFENALYLKKIKNSLKDRDKGKLEIKGKLKDNLTYRGTLDDLLGYCFIGVFILFFLLGLVILIQAILHPFLAGTLSILFLITFGTSFLFFALYWNYFKRK